MLQTVESVERAAGIPSFREQYLKAFRFMLLARTLDDKLASLYRGGKIHGGVFLGRGQEAVSVATGMALRSGDIFAPLIRDGAGRLAFGEALVDATRTYLGSVLGPMRGRDGNIHRGKISEGILPMISHLGAMISVVNGVLLAKRFKKISSVVGASSIGEGGTSTGSFHEAVNQAAVEKLPLVIVVTNNQYAYSTPNSRQFACRDLADKAAGYGIPVSKVDGTDLEKCLQTLSEAAMRAREGGGPQMVIAQLLRLCGHGEHDDAGYIGSALKQLPLGRDCLKVAEDHLLRRAWVDEKQVQKMREDAAGEVDSAVAQALREAGPNPFQEKWCALASAHLNEQSGKQEPPAS